MSKPPLSYFGIKPAALDAATVDAISATGEVGGTGQLTVETINNHVYFYSHVDSDRCLALMQHLSFLDIRLQQERISRNVGYQEPVPIWLHIYSFGGDGFIGLNMVDQFRSFKTPIYSIIEGAAMSAGTLLSIACAKRFIWPRSYMLIHQASGGMWGKYADLSDHMELQDMMHRDLNQFYVENSIASPKEVSNILKHETWLDARKALQYGFVDAIYSSGLDVSKVVRATDKSRNKVGRQIQKRKKRS